MRGESIQDVMTSQPRVCTPNDPVAQAARTMRAADCGALPVVESCDSMRLVGMITDRDITCRIVADGADPNAARVRDAMSGEITSVRLDGTIDECVRLMSARQVRRVPVVDAENRVVGIVAQADLANAARQEGDLEDELAEVVEEISAPSTSSRAD